jgi:putative ABC transport system permease protein
MAKNKTHFLVNVFGLSVSIACASLIALWVDNEWHYDRHFPHADRIYRVYPEININGNDFSNAMAPPPLADVLAKACPEVVASTRVWSYPSMRVSCQQEGQAPQAFNEKRFYQADSNFFAIFDIPMLQGDPQKALLVPFTVVITEETAIRYFGETAYRDGKALGNTVGITFSGQKYDCKVTGITANVPANSHFHYDIILSNVTDPWNKSTVWVDNTYYTYVLLREEAAPSAVEAKLPSIVRAHLDPQLQRNFGTSYDQLRSRGEYWNYKLQPLADIHLRSNFARELEPNGSLNSLWLLLTVALFMLIIACINYTNLSMAGAVERSREVGVRKVLGSTRGQLRRQFFAESAIVGLVALLLAMGLIELFMQPFNQLLGATIPPQPLLRGFTWALLGLIFAVVVFLGGAYPAFYLSSFQPILALKGKIMPDRRQLSFRSVLVTTQFALSIGLAISAVIVYQQLNFLREKSTGFTKENVVLVADPSLMLYNQGETFLHELQQHPSVSVASVCSDYPGSGSYSFPIAAHRQGEATDHLLYNFTAGFDFLKTFGIQLAKGRDFTRVQDSKGPKRVILNETAVKMLALREPLNQFIVTKKLNVLELEEQRYEVIGVVKDFNFESLHKAILPMAIFLDPNGSFVAVRTRAGNLDESIAAMEQTWRKRLPNAPFEYHFLDEHVDQLYQSERSLSRLLTILTGLTIVVAAFGLFGLTLLLVQRRTKEIGVRKVLGASLLDILLVLNREYIRWIALALIIAGPLTYWVMHQWLQHFAYRVSIPWWLFVLSGGVALGIALLTASYHSIRAAQQNPVHSLRNE